MCQLQDSPRIIAARKVRKAIYSCRNVDHCFYVRRLIANFQKMYDPNKQLPFDTWLLKKEISIVHPH